MKTSEKIDLLAVALAKSQGQFVPVPKNKTAKVKIKSGGEYSYSYADLADIISMTTPILSANGLSVMQGINYVDKDTTLLETMLLHSSGQFVTHSFSLRLLANPQEMGSEITYMRRYNLCAALGIHADEDDDAVAASTPPQSKATGSTKSLGAIVSVTHVTAPSRMVGAVIGGPSAGATTISGILAHGRVSTPAQNKKVWAMLKNDLALSDEDARSFIETKIGKTKSSEITSADIETLILAIKAYALKAQGGTNG